MKKMCGTYISFCGEKQLGNQIQSVYNILQVLRAAKPRAATLLQLLRRCGRQQVGTGRRKRGCWAGLGWAVLGFPRSTAPIPLGCCTWPTHGRVPPTQLQPCTPEPPAPCSFSGHQREKDTFSARFTCPALFVKMKRVLT